MKSNLKEKKWLLAFIVACVLLAVAVTAVVILATRKGPEVEGPAPYEEGAEVGIYYYDMVNGEVLLTLSGGNVFILAGPEVNKTGTYTVTNGDMVLDFIRDEDGTTTAKLDGQTISLNYLDATMTFRKKVSYTVSFDCGGDVTTQSVVNGKTVQQPAAPAKEGFVFLGWYADEAYTTPFDFETSTVTENITLYAKLAPTVVGQPEYLVDFVLGYEGAQQPEAIMTVGGKLYEMPAEPVRDGYTFAGWWISTYEDGEKLTCRYTDGMAFSADTTLFALWVQTSGSKLQQPCVSITNAGASWDAVSGASGYHITITSPAGEVIVDEDLGATTRNVDFANMAEGDYKVEVVAVSSNTDNNSEPAVRHFNNKALDRVSRFQVIDGVLAFNAVKNAQRYYVTIECGNPAHNHTMLDNGSSTSFGFANCAMQPGGIRITVTAVANGYANSVSETFVYDKTLSSVENVVYNQAEDAFVWSEVENATGYIVKVTAGDKSFQFTLGNQTTFSMASYTGSISIEVIPVTEGYNSPDATVAQCTKEIPATPSGLMVNGMVLTWDAAMGAESYEVKVGSHTFTTTATTLDLAAEGVQLTSGEVYPVSIKSIAGAESSPYSPAVSVGYGVMNMNLTYSANTVRWVPAFGVSNYEVRVNGVVVATVQGKNYARIRLSQAGVNTIEVRYTDNGGSEWASIDVMAFKVTYNSRSLGGERSEYVAVGDELSLPEDFTNNGYTFGGWYNAPSASKGNGKKIESNIFTGNADTVYYADWTPNDYNINVQVEGFELTNMEQGDFFTVTYTQHFKLEVPVSSNPVYTSFVGWFDGPSGSGTQLTDANGNSVAPFGAYHDITAYPFFETDILTFVESADGTYYEVKAGPNIDNMREVTIPYTYNGIKVRAVMEGGFTTCTDLEVVNIPETIEIVGAGAFYGATKLREINIYEVEGNNDIFYSSYDGVLMRHDMGTVYLDVVPRAKTGTLEIPDYVNAIPSRGIQYTSVTKVIIGKNVTEIFDRAFYRCDTLTTVEFQGGRAQALTLPSTLFYACNEIKTLILPANINEFDTGILTGLKKLENIEVEPNGVVYGSVDGMLTNGKQDTILFAPAMISGDFVVPRGIQHIGDQAFQNNTHITSVTIPNYVLSVGRFAFQGCSKIKSVTVAGVRKNDLSIGGSAFAQCGSLDSVLFEGSKNGDLESGAITIGDSAFAPDTEQERRLRTVKFMDGVNIGKIGSMAFANQSSLYTLSFGENVHVGEIGNGAFQNDERLTSISIPAGCTKIGDNAFKGCTGIASVSFAEGGDEVQFGSGVFAGCSKITTINLPSTLSRFDGSAFVGCDNIKAINVSADSQYLVSENGVLYSKDYTNLLYYPKALDADWEALSKLRWEKITTIGPSVFVDNLKVTSFVIMRNVTLIDSSAFSGCTNLTSITSEITEAEEGVARHLVIGSQAFNGCKKLSSVTIPQYTTSIGKNAFADSKFVTFVMPRDVTSIGENAFRNNTFLTSVVIPSKVTSIGNGAFYNCTSLEQVTFEEGAMLSLGNNGAGNGVFQSCTALRELDMKNRVSVIGGKCFMSSGIRNNSMYTGLVLGSNVTQIGASAFASAKSLTFITIPKSVTLIGISAFADSALAQIDFEVGGTSGLEFGAGVFKNTYLTEITYPGRTTVMAQVLKDNQNNEYYDVADTFEGVKNLKNIFIEGQSDYYKSIDGALYILDADGQPSILLFVPSMNEGTIVDGVASGELIIPKTVIRVDNRALRDINKLHTVTFEEFDKDDENYATQRLTLGQPDSSKSIRDVYAVIGGLETNTITTVNIPSHISAFSAYSISKTKDVVTLNINPDAYDIVVGHNAFYNSKIVTINFPGVRYMYGMAFGGCTTTTTIIYGEKSTLTSLPTNGFNGSGLTEFVVPASVVYLESQAFFAVRNLTSISFAEGSKCKSIGSASFQLDEKLTNVDLSNATMLESIGARTFNNTKITSFTFPDSVKEIGVNLFAQCTELKEIHLSVSITANMLYGMDSGAWLSLFTGCDNLERITVDPANRELMDVDGVLYDKAMTIVYCYPIASKLTNYQIPETIRTIGRSAFTGYKGTAITLPKNLERIELGAFEDSYIEHIVIPASVTSINDFAFRQDGVNPRLKSITFEPGSQLKSIGRQAFFGAKYLTSFYIPDSVSLIGEGAFSGCSGLTEIILPAALKTLNNQTFQNCTGLRKITLQEGLNSIGVDAFSKTQINSIYVPSTVRTLGDKAFMGLDKLAMVTFGKNSILESIGVSAFEDCACLQKLELPAGVKTIGEYAFRNAANMKGINLPAGLTVIPAGMMDGCGNVTSITIPVGVTSIGDRAFANNASITAIDIPAAVTTIGTSAFEGCSSATRIVFASGSAITRLGTDVLGKDNTFKGTTNAKQLVLPANLTFIGGHVFEGCGMEAMTIPANVTEIGEYAFSGCHNLGDVSISTNVTYLGNYAFFDCNSLLNAKLPFGIEYLGEMVFGFCEKLTSANIPATVVRIESNPFAGCYAAGDVTVDPESEYFVVEDGVLYDSAKSTIYCYPTTKTDAVFELPESVSQIAAGAFAGSQLQSMVIPAKMQTIRPYAFADSRNLASVTIESGIKEIGDGAFRGCTSLNNVTIPKSASVLGDYAFADCTSLSKFTFTTGTTYEIGTHFFENCVSMTTLTLPSNFTMNMDDAATYGLVQANGKLATGAKQAIPSYMFAGTGLVNITIPSTVKWIGTDGVFMNCKYLKSVKFQSSNISATYIGNYFFYGCSSLTEINIPRGASAIFSNTKGYSFAYCTSLRTVTINYGNHLPFGKSTSGHMFEGCTSLTTINIKGPANATAYLDYVGPYYFAGCTSLMMITLEDYAAICDSAFEGCTSLMGVTFGGKAGTENGHLAMLGDRAFANCTGCYGLPLPELPDYIGKQVFAGWSNQQALKTFESAEEVHAMLPTGMFLGCQATVYDKDLNVIEIDPETGLLKSN